MYYIDAITTTESQLLAGTTLAEDPTSAWTNTTYVKGDERHVVAKHRVYRCAVDIPVATGISPDQDPTKWKDMRPTNLWAPFDSYTNTAATATVDITYVLASRYCNVVMLRGLLGKDVVISVKDAPGGATIYPATTFRLQHAASGYWDYAFGERKKKTAINITGLPFRKNAEITITVRASDSETRAIGLINRGKLMALHGTRYAVGGVETGASADPKTYTYRKTNEDGTFTTVLRGSSKDLALNVVMDVRQADAAVQSLENIMGKPVGVLASLSNGYAGLSAFGFITKGPVSYRNPIATCSVNVEGIV